jgi:WD40 repeat protein
MDGIARSWDLLLGREQQFFEGAGFTGGVAFNSGGTSVHAVGTDGALYLHNLAITKVLVTGFPVRSFAFGQGAQVVWAACDDKILRSWNLGTNMLDKTIEAGGNAVRVVALSPNGQVIATGGLDPEVRFFQASDLKLISTIKLPGVVKTITFAKDQIVAVGTEDGSIQMLQIPFNQGQPLAPDFGSVVQTLNLGSIPNAISFSKEGKVLFSADAAGNFSEWKIASDAPQKSFGHPNFVDVVAFDPKGLLLATGCHDGKVRLFDIAKGNVVKEIDAHTKAEPSPVYSVLWANDGKRLISCSMQGSIKAWDIPSGTMAYEIKAYKEKEADNGHKEGVFSIAISPDQTMLATAGGDRVIKLWNLQDGKFIRNLVNKGLPNSDKEPASHPGWIYSVRFTPDGKHLLAVGGAPKGKGVLTQWQSSDGSLVAVHEIASGVLYSLSINPDAMSIATSAGTGKQGIEFNQGLVIKLPGLK